MILDTIVLGIAMLLAEMAIRALDLPATRGFRFLVFVAISMFWAIIRFTFNF